MNFWPFWFEQALAREGAVSAQPLAQDKQVDVCIVGGGYTGLWTAITLKQNDPALNIIIIEKDLCGAGASGRNGGCLLTLATKFLTLKRLFGEDEATRLVKASETAVTRIAEFCKQHDIDAEVRVDGALYTATNAAQIGCLNPVLAELAARGLSSWSKLPPDRVQHLSGSVRHQEGFFSPQAGSVQPGLLVRELARVARAMGVIIHENTAMTTLRETPQPQVVTPGGIITAGKVVLALNAWMATTFPQFSRTVAIVSSDMVVTDPRPDLLKNMGLTTGLSVCDSRIFVHYYRNTPDGRIMLGKGGNTFAFGGRMLEEFDKPSRYEGQLRQAMNHFFPAFRDVPLTASWNGPSDRSVTGFPFFGRLNNHPAIFYGFGYSGNGVGPAWMGGQILSSLVLGLDNEWSRCGFVGGPRGYFPPEPIRWLGSMMVRNAIRRKEAAEDADCTSWWIDRQLARFANAAGKADKA